MLTPERVEDLIAQFERQRTSICMNTHPTFLKIDDDLQDTIAALRELQELKAAAARSKEISDRVERIGRWSP